MKIRDFLFGFLAIELVMAMSIVVLAQLLGQTLRDVEKAQTRRHESYLLADELRQSSDDLTRFPRTYAVTGDGRFERYFRQTLDIRNGVLPRPQGYDGIYWDLVAAGQLKEPRTDQGDLASLQERRSAAGFTAAEFDKLKEAQDRSDQLVALENRAMNAVKGRFDDGSGTFPNEAEPDMKMAADILHGERYHNAKAAIMKPVGEFLLMVDERTNLDLERLNVRERHLVLAIFITSGALAFCLTATVWVLYRRIIRRIGALEAAATNVVTGNLSVRSGVSGKDELGILGQTFDTMLDRLSGSLERSQAETQEIESRMEAIFKNTSDGFLTLSRDTLSIQSVNPAIEKMLGLNAEDIANLPVSRFLFPSEKGEHQGEILSGAVGPLFHDLASSGRPCEMIGRRSDGSKFATEVVISEATVSEMPVFIAAVRDVSAWKHLLDRRSAELRRLSTPVTQIWEGILSDIPQITSGMRPNDSRTRRTGKQTLRVFARWDAFPLTRPPWWSNLGRLRLVRTHLYLRHPALSS
jgi:methyl-accepting chemotaxis protein